MCVCVNTNFSNISQYCKREKNKHQLNTPKKCCTQAPKFSILLLILVQVSMIKLQNLSQMG